MHKQSAIAIKELTDKGSGVAVFATLNVIDKDGDLTKPGAFGEQTAKFVAAHDWSAPPIGVAKIHEEGDLAIAKFQINLEMPSGAEWYRSLKFSHEHGVSQEFSYGFDIAKESFEERDGRRIRVLEKLKVHEVSPVMIGAGVNTHLRMMKGSRSMEEHFEAVLTEIDEFLTRTTALTALRAKENRDPVSQAVRGRMEVLSGRLAKVQGDIKALLAGPGSHDQKENILAVQAQWTRTQQRLSGHIGGLNQ